MSKLPLMFKTTYRCNQDCAYCYYRNPADPEHSAPFISLELLESFLPAYLRYIAPSREASFGWQGGEPTLAGLPFFRAVVEMQMKHGVAGTIISNDIQTNGILIDDEWARFLSDYQFLVGVSLDGPESFHNVMRRGPTGRGSFEQTMAGIAALRKRDVELNVLCVISDHNVRFAEELLAFFAKEKFDYIQLIPAMGFPASEPSQAADYLVRAREYAEFLKTAFDIWYGDGYPRFSLRTFDSFLQSYLGQDSGLCIHAKHCNPGLIIETSGDVYPCDFYLESRFRIGNLKRNTIEELVQNQQRLSFINQKKNLPLPCQHCSWQPICNGGCPRNYNRGGQDYLCESYAALLRHADTRFKKLAERIQSRARFLRERDTQREIGKPLPGRNEPCPCRSGLKHKRCCGHPALLQSYLFRDDL